MAQQGCTEPRPSGSGCSRGRRAEALAASYLPLVKAIAAQVYQKLPPGVGVEWNDLAQAGFLGLLRAAGSFDERMAVSFGLYARHRIRGEIMDSLRRQDLASRHLRRWHKQVERTARDLAARWHRHPSEEEIYHELGWDPAEVREKRLAIEATRSHAAQRSEGPEPQLPGSPETRPDAICLCAERRRVLARAVRRLPPRSQAVISLYYDGEMTMKEIGRVLRVNESRVSQLHKGALHAIGRNLRASGIRRGADL